MIVSLHEARLLTGETVAAAVVRAPDEAWADRIEPMLRHKGELWRWQNSEVLRQETGLEARFFVLHREGVPFANLMVVETNGVGFLGHVWTESVDRGRGASSALMEMALEDFRKRGSRALFLGTDFDSPPWHFYHRRGFQAIEAGSGYMELYFQRKDEFEAAWFGSGESRIEQLGWPDWPASVPLFAGPWPGVVRMAGMQLVGRRSPEEPLLPSLRYRLGGERGCVRVLRAADGGAVLGMASWMPDPLWREASVLDVYCHPQWWHRADDLLQALPLPSNSLVAYADANFAAKVNALERAGFARQGSLPKWVAVDAARFTGADVAIYTRR